MHTKSQVSLTRKILYGIILLGISPFAFGARNLPTAHAQKGTTNTSTLLSAPDYNVYYGSLHAHTNYSGDATIAPADAFQYARDTAKLDFFGLSDHDEDITPEEWDDTQVQADAFNQDGVFVTFRGFEWSNWTDGGIKYGHIVVVNTANYIAWNDPSWNYDTYDEFTNWLNNQPDGIAIFAHPGLNSIVDGRQFELYAHGASSKVVAQELWNGATGEAFSEYYYSDGFYSGDGGLGYYDEALTRGIKIGAGGGCDTHDIYVCNHGNGDANWRMAVLATEKTRAAIYSALQARRIFSTLDKNLTMSFQLNGQEMGSTIDPGTYNIDIKLGDGNSEVFNTVKLIKNGTVVNTWTPNSSAPTITQSITTASGEYYYILVTQQDGDEAISSPIWVNPSPTVSSSVRTSASPTSAPSVGFTVTFSKPVTGVDSAHFELNTNNVTGAAITNVSGSGTTYAVTVNTGSGSGTIRLDIPVTATIADLVGNSLSELPFIGGETYTIDKTEINVRGKNKTILDNDTSPSTTDDTNFGSVDIASVSVDHTFTIENIGTLALNLTGTPKVSISGTNASDFAITADPVSPVAGNTSTTFTVHFDPSATGTRTVIITIANNDSDENPYNFNIQGTGIIGVPEINVKGNGNSINDGDIVPDTTDHTDFGSTDVSSGTVDHTFTIENIGTGALNLTGTPKVSISGTNATDFTVTVDPISPVAVSGSTPFTIHFDPSAAGTRTATINIANNDSNENPYNFNIQGTGIASSTKDITAFSFTSPAATGVISGTNIAVTAPFGTNVSSLVANFTTTGASIKVGGITQVSGTTANNFTNPVTYTVTAADASTQNYTVTVTVAANSAKAITAFSFTSPAATGVITGTNIAVSVPFGTNVTSLVASFTTTGASVKVGGTTQVSGTTANNFTNPVTYTVTAANASTQNYIVTVIVAANSAKAITAFSFTSPAATGVITGTNIAITVPFGTNVTALVATFTSTGASIKVGGTTQVSGTTANNFTNPVTYTVTAADASTQNYTITVTVAANPTKAITAFSFTSPGAIGVISEAVHTIAVTVPFGTNVSSLVANFTTTGASVKVGGTTQVSGTTANNFTNPVTYTVTAADASTQNYTVTVTVAANPAKAITAFSFTSPAAIGVISEAAHTIAVTVPFGTDVSSLVANFTTTGTSVKVGGTTQVSGTTANSFTNPVTYTVTAADASTQNYTVTVTVAANPAKAITTFSFASPTATGSISEASHTIAVTIPFGTDVSSLVASFATTGASVKVGGTTQVSGTTANNFTNPVTYTVTAADASTQNYTVTVTVAANPAKDITAFSFSSPAATGAFSGTNIAVTVPFGTDVSSLVANFTTTGASVKVGSTTQVSGTTANNFTNPVTYTVTAADASTQNYTVTVTVASETVPPIVNSIILVNSNPTASSNVDFKVTFSESVTDMDIIGPQFDDFTLTTSGISGASITAVSGSGTTYTVTVNTGTGNGTLRLDVIDHDAIVDGAGNKLGGTGFNNGNFTSGGVYTIKKPASGGDTAGIFRPGNGTFYLRNSNSAGSPDITIKYGLPGDYPLVGDWDGNGTDTIGVYRKGIFYLSNSNTTGHIDLSLTFGKPGDQPIAGDWNGDGIDTIGVYRSSKITFLLRNSNTSGAAEITFKLGSPSDVGIAGDWNGDGTDTTGVFRPSNGALYLKNANTTGYADIVITYGVKNDKPVTGDWNDDKIASIGIYRNAQFYLRNTNTKGYADFFFTFGAVGDMPLAGNWDGIP